MRRTIVGALCVLLLVAAAPSQAQQEGSPIPTGVDLLPGVTNWEGTSGFDPNSTDDCLAGREECVDAVIRKMTRHVEPLASSCDHNVIFALTYLRTTENYKATLFWDPPLFRDRARVNHFDEIFASYYFAAWKSWQVQNGKTPPAWRIHFQAADDHATSGRANVIAGTIAHIQNDLPQVLYETGLVDDQGVSRKDDHDAANKFLYEGTPAIFAELSRRFDPTVDDSDQPGELDNALSFETIVAWREQAWRDAERLALAPNDAARALIVRDIEARAAANVAAAVGSGAYPPGSGGAAARDAYCAEHWDDV
ncbi:MAG: DUF5995 family protein [Actinomycetota bacterium]|nr:DUF5995 family protein [Actinomycetota bacterium]